MGISDGSAVFWSFGAFLNGNLDNTCLHMLAFISLLYPLFINN